MTWSRYTKLERVNATIEKKAKGKGKNVDGDRHVYAKSQEDATSTSERVREGKSDIFSNSLSFPYSRYFFLLFLVREL